MNLIQRIVILGIIGGSLGFFIQELLESDFSKAFPGLNLITNNVESYDCQDVVRMSKDLELQNAFGAKFPILYIENPMLVMRDQGKIVCHADVITTFSEEKMALVIRKRDSGELMIEVKQINPDEKTESQNIPADSQRNDRAVQKTYPDFEKLVSKYPSDFSKADSEFQKFVLSRLPLTSEIVKALNQYGVETPFTLVTRETVVASQCKPGDCNSNNITFALSKNGQLVVVLRTENECALYTTKMFKDTQSLDNGDVMCPSFVFTKYIE